MNTELPRVEVGEIIRVGNPARPSALRHAIVIDICGNKEPHDIELLVQHERNRILQAWANWDGYWKITGGQWGQSDASRLQPFKEKLETFLVGQQ